MSGIAFALAASLSWGCSDFLGGLKSRAVPVVAVLAVSQPAGLGLVAIVLLLRGGEAPSGGEWAWAAAAGAVGLLALTAFYRGLAAGAMSVVAPVSATATAVPLAVGLARGERPGAIQAAGVGLALAGVVLASREPAGDAAGNRLAAGFGFAVLAALGFGFFFVAVDTASDGGASALWVTFVLRAASSSLVLAAALALRPRLPRQPATLAVLLAVERISRSQQAGVALALAGVAAISAG